MWLPPKHSKEMPAFSKKDQLVSFVTEKSKSNCSGMLIPKEQRFQKVSNFFSNASEINKQGQQLYLNKIVIQFTKVSCSFCVSNPFKKDLDSSCFQLLFNFHSVCSDRKTFETGRNQFRRL